MKFVTLFSFLIFVTKLGQGFAQDPVNVALNKVISAQVGCGTYGRESYNLNSETGVIDGRQTFYCDVDTIPSPGNMLDGDALTQWQSTSRANIYDEGFGDRTTHREAVIDVDLQQVFQVERILFDMNESARPGRIMIAKSFDGIVYTPWLHKVSLQEDCGTLFGVPFQARPTDADPTTCTLYTSLEKAILQEIIEFDISLESFAFRQAHFLRITFFRMNLILGIFGNTFQHYTVRELTVMAQCSCYVHDIACDQSNVTGQYECVCGDNTQGEYCSLCQPFYNQQDFMADIPCEACNCFGHSEQCFFDAGVALQNLSLNAAGVYSGGGVCIDCLHNTTGLNCQSCSPYFYRPTGVLQSAQDACVACDCEPRGVTLSPLGRTGDCVVNAESPEAATKAPGDCYCKANVQGSRCDQCKPGYYDLRGDNPLGCSECGCETAGTVGNSGVCNTNSTGQCPCKPFVTGRQCNTCQEGYFNLSPTNLNGCDPCNCDPGGMSSGGCNKIDGQCTCKLHITGRQCDSVADGYYYPDFHYVHAEAETPTGVRGEDVALYPGFLGYGYAILNVNEVLTISLDVPAVIPASGLFSLVFRYITNTAITGSATVTGPTGVVDSSGVTFTACAQWCYLQVGGDAKLFTLTAGTRYTVTLAGVSGTLLVDRVVAIPQEFLSPTVLGAPGTTFRSDCKVLDNGMNTPSCSEKIFTVIMGSLQSALPCGCHLVGSSSSSVCDKVGGQCTCRQGVEGRQCNQCMPDHYQMTFDGCKACNCAGANKLCESVSGQCYCSPNTRGRQCDLCDPNHFSWTEANGCTPCGCDIGSTRLQCNATSGVCSCNTGVIGDKCDVCEDNFKSLTSIGCVDCGCDSSGSLTPLCNKTSGQCSCKVNTEGLLCNQCAAGTFDLDIIHPKGCADCVCMGVTSDCTSSFHPLKQNMLPLLDAQSSNLTSFLTLVTSAGADSGVQVMGQRRPIEPFLVANIDGAQELFWQVNSGEIAGNLLGLYGSYIEFDLSYAHNATSSNFVPLKAMMFYNQGQSLSQTISVVPTIGVPNPVKLRVIETEWLQAAGTPLSRQEFLLALTSVQAWHLPATIVNVPHETSLSNVMYTVASPGAGTGTAAVHVEQCQCGPGYQGSSCEWCAVGYKRFNVTGHPYRGLCEPCACNGHSNECSPDTGECINCQQNTQGASCEQCLPGYYGDPTTADGCFECPCYAPRVSDPSCNIVNGTTITCLNCNTGYTGPRCDRCELFYFGRPEILGTGTCTACDCNGNSDQCDPITGVCINCGSDTTGDNCERCLNTFYGNATQKTCQPCGCIEAGRQSMVCDHLSGQCTCLPGVGGRTCDSCELGFWGYTNTAFPGCQDCQCNPEGSSSLQCTDATAECPCKPNTAGVRCDTCDNGFWGLPTRACSACECNPDGSVDPTAPCDLVSGQCGCKPGIEGRQCDVCQRLYEGTVQTGCTGCGQCQESLGNDTLALQQTWDSYWAVASGVGLIQEQDSILQSISADLAAAKTDLGISDLTAQALQEIVNTLNNQMSSYSTEVSSLQTRLDGEVLRCETLRNNTLTEENRLNVLVGESETTLNTANLALANVRTNIIQLENHKTTADGYLQNTGIQTVNGTLSFAADRQIVDAELAEVQAAAAEVTSSKEQVDTQIADTSNLELRRVSLQTDGEGIRGRTTAVDADSAQLLALKQSTESLLQSTQSQIAVINTLVNGTTATLDTATVQLQGVTENQAAAVSDLDDCAFVLGDNPSNLPLPLNTTVDIAGIQSFPLGYAAISSAVDQTLANIQAVDGAGAVTLAGGLQSQAQALQGDYQLVEPLGRDAVAAKQNFENAVSSLSASMTRAQEASQTVTQQSQAVAGVNLPNLEAQAITERNRSTALLGEVTSKNYQPAALEAQIQSARDGLQVSVNDWNTLIGRVDLVTAQAQALDPVTKQNVLADLRTQADSTAAMVQSAATLTITNDQVTAEQLSTLTSESVGIQEQSQSASNVVDTVASKVQQYTDRLRTVEDLLARSETAYNQSDVPIGRIDQRLTDLSARILHARQLARALGQPVSFTTNSNPVVAANPVALRDEFCSHVSLEFKAPSGSSGLLLFAEDPNSPAKLTLELENGFVVFRFAINFEVVQMTNPAEVAHNEWARVEASRCGNIGQLSVTVLSTGATAMTSRAGLSLSARTLQLTTDLYVGGLPPEYNTTKVSVRSFQGCLYNLWFGLQEIPLWDLSVQAGEARCCRKPVYFNPIPSAPGTSLSGFGHLQVGLPGFDIMSPSRISVKFQTFTPDGVLFIIDAPLIGVYYGVFLVNGRVVFDIDTGNKYQIQSAETYNDGQWYMVTTVLSATEQQLELQYSVNGTFFQQEVLSAGLAGINLLQLQNRPVTFGSLNPGDNTSPTPVKTNLPVTLSDFHYGVLGGTPPTQYVSANVISESEVYRDVPSQVYIGMTLFTDVAYAEMLLPDRATIASISIFFSTYDTNGILVYSVSAAFNDVFIYIALRHGNIVVYCNDITGGNLKGPIETTGLFLSDGTLHGVKVQIRSDTLRVELSVDNVLIDDSVTLSFATFALSTSPLYLGGVPDPTQLGTLLPVRDSLIGGIGSLLYNTRTISLVYPAEYVGHRDVSLAHIPKPRSVPIPPPVTPPPGGLPSCLQPQPGGRYSDAGRRFGDSSVSFQKHALTPTQVAELSGSFALSLQFRSFASNGILFYMADRPVDPTRWFSLYLMEGYIIVSMQTSSQNHNTAFLRSSLSQYNNGMWFEVDVLRINDFLAMVVTDENDYINNNVNSSFVSTLPLLNELYLGGLDSAVSGNIRPAIEIEKTPLIGCIRRVELTPPIDRGQPFLLDLQAPMDEGGTSKCFSNAVSGVRMSGSSSYLSIAPSDIFSFDALFQFSVNIRTTTRNGNLFTLYQSAGHFIVLDIAEGMIRCIIGNPQNQEDAFIVTSDKQPNAFSLCNNEVHAISVEITSTELRLGVGSADVQVVPFLAGFTPVTITGFFSIGGIPPNLAASVTFPVRTSQTSFNGCLDQLTLNGQFIEPQFIQDKAGVSYGCFV